MTSISAYLWRSTRDNISDVKRVLATAVPTSSCQFGRARESGDVFSDWRQYPNLNLAHRCLELWLDMTNQTVYDTENKGKRRGNFTDYRGFIFMLLVWDSFCVTFYHKFNDRNLLFLSHLFPDTFCVCPYWSKMYTVTVNQILKMYEAKNLVAAPL